MSVGKVVTAPVRLIWSLIPDKFKKWAGKRAEVAIIAIIAARLRNAINKGGASMEGNRSQIIGGVIAALGALKVWAQSAHPEWVQWIDLTIGILAGVFGVTLAAKVERGNVDAKKAAEK